MKESGILQVVKMAKATLSHVTTPPSSPFPGLQFAFARFVVAILVQLSFTFTRL